MCLREVGVLEFLSIASRKRMKSLPSYLDEELVVAMKLRKNLKITKNTYPLANTSFLPLVVLE